MIELIKRNRIFFPVYCFIKKRFYIVRWIFRVIVQVIPGINSYIRPAEIHDIITLIITYKCNLHCINCNANCSQAPTDLSMSLNQVNKFINESIQNNYQWKKIRISGGEPTLHKDILEIVTLLLSYKEQFSPNTQILINTNYYSSLTKNILKQLPEKIKINSSSKTTNKNRFHPINLAPIDCLFYKYTNYSIGCEIIKNCGIALGPYGYYPCPYQSGFDRILQFGLGEKNIKDLRRTYQITNKKLCSYCGTRRLTHSTNIWKVSYSWYVAINKYLSQNKNTHEYF